MALPNDILLSIAALVPIRHVYSAMRRVCKSWYACLSGERACKAAYARMHVPLPVSEADTPRKKQRVRLLARCALVPALLRLLPRACIQCDRAADTRKHAYFATRLCARCRLTPQYHMTTHSAARSAGLSESDLGYLRCASHSNMHGPAPMRLYFHADVQRALRDKYADLDRLAMTFPQRSRLTRDRARVFDTMRHTLQMDMLAQLCTRYAEEQAREYVYGDELRRLLVLDGDHRRPQTIHCRKSFHALMDHAHAYFAAHANPI